MSAFGGKADVDQAPTLRPLPTQIGRIGFGHSWESQCASMGTPDGALSQSTDGAGVIREEEKSIDPSEQAVRLHLFGAGLDSIGP
jgi:hypothetical protein